MSTPSSTSAFGSASKSGTAPMLNTAPASGFLGTPLATAGAAPMPGAAATDGATPTMFSASDGISGGFARPVFDAQAVFRAALDALSRPGTIVPVAALAAPPAPLSATAAALVLALADADTPVFLDAPLALVPAVRAYIAFHAGAPVTADPAEAAFAVIADPAALPPLAAFAQGTADYPDRSTTLILQVATLAVGEPAGATPTGASAASAGAPTSTPDIVVAPGAPTITLAGPGIADTARIAAAPLPPSFSADWAANHALYPCGIDLLLAGPDAVAGLPRTTRIAFGDAPCT